MYSHINLHNTNPTHAYTLDPTNQLVSGLGSVLYNLHAGNPFVAYGEARFYVHMCMYMQVHLYAHV